jgi:hypothetical protein
VPATNNSIPGVTADALTALFPGFGGSCDESSGSWDCAAVADDGSDLTASFQGADGSHITDVSADVTQYGPYDPAAAVDFLAAMAEAAAGSSGSSAASWVRGYFGSASPGTIAEKTFGAAHVIARFLGGDTGNDASIQVCRAGAC